jgi:hypothetical protein
MIPIVEFPSIVTSATPWFEDVFTKPQLRNFQTYASGLVLSPIHTISYMNSIFYAHSDQSALNNWATSSTWSDEKLEDARYKYILEGIRRCEKDTEGEGILILDNTLSHHESAKHMEFAGKFYDHADESYTWAHDVVTSHLVKGRLSIPLSFEIYLKDDQLNEKYLASISRKKAGDYTAEDAEQILESETFKSKNQIARELVSKAKQKGVPFSYVVGDSAYLNFETVVLIESLKKSWVFGCKSDRVVAMPGGRWISLSEWAKTVPDQKFKRVSVRYEKKEHFFWAYAKSLVMRSLGKRRIRVVVTYDNKERKGDPNFYCSNELDCDSYKVLSVYAKRWRIDASYRESKQNLGLEDYQMRKLSGARRHISMVFTAYALLVLGSAFAATAATDDGKKEEAASSSPKLSNNIKVAKAEACLTQTIGSRCRTVCTEALAALIDVAFRIAAKVGKCDPKWLAQMLTSSKTTLQKSAKV